MADLNNLQLRDDVVEMTGDPSAIPDQPQGFSRMPQPRSYTIRLPENLISAWERFDYNHPLSGQPLEGVFLKFDGEHALVISGDDFKGENVGESLRTNISGYLYKVNEKGQRRKDGHILVSDLMYLVRALGGSYPQSAKNSDKITYINGLASGKEVKADWEWSSFCNPKKDVYDESGKRSEGNKGCGQRYFQSQMTKKDGVYSERFTCTGEITQADGTKVPCGASLRAFGNLTRFKPAGAAGSQ